MTHHISESADSVFHLLSSRHFDFHSPTHQWAAPALWVTLWLGHNWVLCHALPSSYQQGQPLDLQLCIQASPQPGQTCSFLPTSLYWESKACLTMAKRFRYYPKQNRTLLAIMSFACNSTLSALTFKEEMANWPGLAQWSVCFGVDNVLYLF